MGEEDEAKGCEGAGEERHCVLWIERRRILWCWVYMYKVYFGEASRCNSTVDEAATCASILNIIASIEYDARFCASRSL